MYILSSDMCNNPGMRSLVDKSYMIIYNLASFYIVLARKCMVLHSTCKISQENKTLVNLARLKYKVLAR